MGSFGARDRIVLDGCEVDVGQCEIVRDGARQRLTTKELEVLAYLARHPSRSISHEELLERVWGHSRLASTQPVYSVVKRLRRKLDAHGAHRHIVSVHGVGYRFDPPSAIPAVVPEAPTAARLTSFVGRTDELARLEAAFASDARIVTLVGPGGGGKSRIAAEHALRVAERGCELVVCELGAVRDDGEVETTIAAVLGARIDREIGHALSSVTRTLHARGVWGVVLDDAEHVLDATAHVAQALAPRVRVLVTSRERMGLLGEHVIEVGPMPTADASRLFLDRARAAGASLDENAEVGDIVERLDGLPLALELTAAHASVVSLARAREDLKRSIDRVVATRRGVPARQSTLRSSVEWSWSLCDADERAVLAQCVVFARGFSPDATERVVAVRGSVRQHLVRLSERSLVRRLPGAAEGARFDLYRCVRELAEEHEVDRDALRDRFVAWAHALVGTMGALDDVPHPELHARLAPDRENLVAALRHGLERDDARCAAIAAALHRLDGRSPEVVALIERARASARGPDALRLALVTGAALVHRGAEGLAQLEATRALADASGSLHERLEAERLVGAGLAALGQPGRALPRLEAALDHARSAGGRALVEGRIALDLAEVHLAAGSLERARELAAEAVRALETAGDHANAARAASVLAHVHRDRRAHDEALAALERARRLLEDAGDEDGLARLELDRGVMLADAGASAGAEPALGAAIAAHHRLGLLPGEIRARDWMVLVLLGLGRDEGALAQARELQQLALDLGRPLFEVDRAFGATWLVVGAPAEADAALTRALEVLESGGRESLRGHVLSMRALARTLAGDLEGAESDLVACSEVHAARGSPAARLHGLAELAVVRELAAPREDTDAILRSADGLGPGRAWDLRHAEGRRAVVAIARAVRRGAGPDALAELTARARSAILDGAEQPSDYFTRCTLRLVDRAAALVR